MKKIAIVNTSEIHREFLSQVIGSYGYETVLFQDTQVAFKGLLYYLDEIGAILIDHTVTSKCLRNLISQMKSENLLNRIPIIICSKKSLSRQYQDLFDKGIGYLSKPIDRKTLKVNLTLSVNSENNPQTSSL